MKYFITIIFLCVCSTVFSQDTVVIKSIDNSRIIKIREINYSDATQNKHSDISFDFSCPQIVSGLNKDVAEKINKFLEDEFYKKSGVKASEVKMSNNNHSKQLKENIKQEEYREETIEGKTDFLRKALEQININDFLGKDTSISGIITINDNSNNAEHDAEEDNVETNQDSTETEESDGDNSWWFEHTSATFSVSAFNHDFLTISFNWMHEAYHGGSTNYSKMFCFDVKTGNTIKLSDIFDTLKYDEIKKIIIDKFSGYPSTWQYRDFKDKNKFDTIVFNQSPVIGLNSIGFYISKFPIDEGDWLEGRDNDENSFIYLRLEDIKNVFNKNGYLKFLKVETPKLSKKITNRNQIKIPSFYPLVAMHISYPIYLKNIEETFAKSLSKNKIKELKIETEYNHAKKSMDTMTIIYDTLGKIYSIKNYYGTFEDRNDYWSMFFYDKNPEKVGEYGHVIDFVPRPKMASSDIQGNIVYTDFVEYYERFYSNNDNSTIIEIGRGEEYGFYYIKQFYDSHNNLTHEELINSSGENGYNVFYTYGKNKLQTQTSALDIKGDTILKVLKIYDKSKRIVHYIKKLTRGIYPDDLWHLFPEIWSRSLSYGNISFEDREFEYDKNGNLIKINYNKYSDGHCCQAVREFIYDENDKLLKIVEGNNSNNTKSIKSISYTYY